MSATSKQILGDKMMRQGLYPRTCLGTYWQEKARLRKKQVLSLNLAQRRMFNKSVIKSGKFLKLPATAQALYLQLGMDVDDDNYVDATAILFNPLFSKEDLRALRDAGFIKVCSEEDLILYIIHGPINNTLKNDRYNAGIYTSKYPIILDPPVETPNENSGTNSGDTTNLTNEHNELTNYDGNVANAPSNVNTSKMTDSMRQKFSKWNKPKEDT